MYLEDFKNTRFNKMNNALKEVFGVDFNFGADLGKLQKVKESTVDKIQQLRDNGVEVSDRDFQKLVLIKNALDEAIQTKEESVKKTVMENDLDQAEVLLAAKQLADDLQKMAENLASMQVEELMSITNAMKEEVGTAEAEAFNQSAESAISGALDAVKSANEQISNAVLTAQGQAPQTDMSMDIDNDVADDLDIDTQPEDDFGGADAADAMSDDTGREMKEDAYLSALKMVKEAQSEGKVSTELLQKAFAVLRAK